MMKGVPGIEEGLCFQPGPQNRSTDFLDFLKGYTGCGAIGGAGAGYGQQGYMRQRAALQLFKLVKKKVKSKK